jgi:hypothetical protein
MARREMRTATDALEAKDYEVALAHCRRAMSLVPEANLPHKCAGRALEALLRWPEAIEEYETYLRIKADVSDATFVRTHIDEMQAAKASLSMHCAPTFANVEVDGKDLPPNASGHYEMNVSRGPHRIRIRAPGFVAQDFDVTAMPPAPLSPTCNLVRQPELTASARISVAPQEIEPRRTTTPWYGHWWVWGATGVVLAGSIATVALLARQPTTIPATEGGNHVFPP